MIKKKTKRVSFDRATKTLATFAVVAITLCGSYLAVTAYSGGSPKVVVEGNYIESTQLEGMESLGAYGDTNVTNLVASGYITSSGALTVVGATSLTGTVSVVGAVTVDTFTQGGGITASTTYTAGDILTYSHFDTEDIVEMDVSQAFALVLPATSTLSLMIPNAGDTREILLVNATTTAAITITAGTGMDFQTSSSTSDCVIGTLDMATLKFWRKANRDMYVICTQAVEAD